MTMKHADLIADNRRWVELHQHNPYQAEAARRMTAVLDVLEAITGDDAVERGAEAAHYAQGFDDYGVANEDEMEDARGIARVVLNAATGDNHE